MTEQKDDILDGHVMSITPALLFFSFDQINEKIKLAFHVTNKSRSFIPLTFIPPSDSRYFFEDNLKSANQRPTSTQQLLISFCATEFAMSQDKFVIETRNESLTLPLIAHPQYTLQCLPPLITFDPNVNQDVVKRTFTFEPQHNLSHIFSVDSFDLHPSIKLSTKEGTISLTESYIFTISFTPSLLAENPIHTNLGRIMISGKTLKPRTTILELTDHNPTIATTSSSIALIPFNKIMSSKSLSRATRISSTYSSSRSESFSFSLSMSAKDLDLSSFLSDYDDSSWKTHGNSHSSMLQTDSQRASGDTKSGKRRSHHHSDRSKRKKRHHTDEKDEKKEGERKHRRHKRRSADLESEESTLATLTTLSTSGFSSLPISQTTTSQYSSSLHSSLFPTSSSFDDKTGTSFSGKSTSFGSSFLTPTTSSGLATGSTTGSTTQLTSTAPTSTFLSTLTSSQPDTRTQTDSKATTSTPRSSLLSSTHHPSSHPTSTLSTAEAESTHSTETTSLLTTQPTTTQLSSSLSLSTTQPTTNLTSTPTTNPTSDSLSALSAASPPFQMRTTTSSIRTTTSTSSPLDSSSTQMPSSEQSSSLPTDTSDTTSTKPITPFPFTITLNTLDPKKPPPPKPALPSSLDSLISSTQTSTSQFSSSFTHSSSSSFLTSTSRFTIELPRPHLDNISESTDQSFSFSSSVSASSGLDGVMGQKAPLARARPWEESLLFAKSTIRVLNVPVSVSLDRVKCCGMKFGTIETAKRMKKKHNILALHFAQEKEALRAFDLTHQIAWCLMTTVKKTQDELDKLVQRKLAISQDELNMLFNWAYALLPTQRSVPRYELFYTGENLCSMIDKLSSAEQNSNTPTRINGVLKRSKTKAACERNIEQALSVVWKRAPKAKRMPTASEVFEHKNPTVVVNLLLETFDIFITRPTRARLKQIIQWMNRVLSLFKVAVPPDIDGPKNHDSLWRFLKSGTIFCLISYAYTPPTLDTQSDASQSPIALTSVFFHPQTDSEAISNLTLAFSCFQRLSIPLFFTPESFHSSNVSSFVIFQLDLIYRQVQGEPISEHLLNHSKHSQPSPIATETVEYEEPWMAERMKCPSWVSFKDDDRIQRKESSPLQHQSEEESAVYSAANPDLPTHRRTVSFNPLHVASLGSLTGSHTSFLHSLTPSGEGASTPSLPQSTTTADTQTTKYSAANTEKKSSGTPHSKSTSQSTPTLQLNQAPQERRLSLQTNLKKQKKDAPKYKSPTRENKRDSSPGSPSSLGQTFVLSPTIRDEVRDPFSDNGNERFLKRNSTSEDLNSGLVDVNTLLSLCGDDAMASGRSRAASIQLKQSLSPSETNNALGPSLFHLPAIDQPVDDPSLSDPPLNTKMTVSSMAIEFSPLTSDDTENASTQPEPDTGRTQSEQIEAQPPPQDTNNVTPQFTIQNAPSATVVEQSESANVENGTSSESQPLLQTSPPLSMNPPHSTVPTNTSPTMNTPNMSEDVSTAALASSLPSPHQPSPDSTSVHSPIVTTTPNGIFVETIIPEPESLVVDATARPGFQHSREPSYAFNLTLQSPSGTPKSQLHPQSSTSPFLLTPPADKKKELRKQLSFLLQPPPRKHDDCKPPLGPYTSLTIQASPPQDPSEIRQVSSAGSSRIVTPIASRMMSRSSSDLSSHPPEQRRIKRLPSYAFIGAGDNPSYPFSAFASRSPSPSNLYQSSQNMLRRSPVPSIPSLSRRNSNLSRLDDRTDSSNRRSFQDGTPSDRYSAPNSRMGMHKRDLSFVLLNPSQAIQLRQQQPADDSPTPPVTSHEVVIRPEFPSTRIVSHGSSPAGEWVLEASDSRMGDPLNLEMERDRYEPSYAFARIGSMSSLVSAPFMSRSPSPIGMWQTPHDGRWRTPAAISKTDPRMNMSKASPSGNSSNESSPHRQRMRSRRLKRELSFVLAPPPPMNNSHMLLSPSEAMGFGISRFEGGMPFRPTEMADLTGHSTASSSSHFHSPFHTPHVGSASTFSCDQSDTSSREERNLLLDTVGNSSAPFFSEEDNNELIDVTGQSTAETMSTVDSGLFFMDKRAESDKVERGRMWTREAHDVPLINPTPHQPRFIHSSSSLALRTHEQLSSTGPLETTSRSTTSRSHSNRIDSRTTRRSVSADRKKDSQLSARTQSGNARRTSTPDLIESKPDSSTGHAGQRTKGTHSKAESSAVVSFVVNVLPSRKPLAQPTNFNSLNSIFLSSSSYSALLTVSESGDIRLVSTANDTPIVELVSFHVSDLSGIELDMSNPSVFVLHFMDSHTDSALTLHNSPTHPPLTLQFQTILLALDFHRQLATLQSLS
ncbi:hypothetical protein BLNAU_12577 [Blattamonas nauphoetae]|uniref:Calponin-homology (CH) domain-containing protein n=1 Tax=Blattamonas nauphoetae TaxID=2049346 RepID=A0ABQ9XKD3_9EUKA|nr:hypothetical protein BLNAU_12577 [Blattamonas nauphoetae]